MKKILKISLKKKNDKLNNAVITLNKKICSSLGLEEQDCFIFSYENKIIKIEPFFSEYETYERYVRNKLEIKKILKLQKGKKINIPLGILEDFGVSLDKENYISYFLNNNKLIIKLESEEKREKKMIENIGKILTVKVNKGGVGKTFTTVQLGAFLALNHKKVLLLTSDSQNNILDYTLGKTLEFDKGLKAFVKGEQGEIIKLRENLFFIPLESSKFASQFLIKLPDFLDKMKKEYDYIIIDSIPTMAVDTVFVKNSDKVIIPTFCDRVTVEGVINVIQETGADKILAILINKYENKKIQNIFKQEIEEALKNTDILFLKPIKNTSEVENLLYKGKTIWESNNKKIIEIQDIFIQIGNALLNNSNPANDFDIDF